MKQLSVVDSMFIFNETARCPQHIGGLTIVDPSTALGGKITYNQVLNMIVERSHLAPFLKQRLLEVPWNLDFPYWVNIDDFDPEFHIRHIALPAPGNWQQLCTQVARIHARQLDRSKPLWEIYVIEGLGDIDGIPKGCIAYLTKTHHACIDGTSSSDIGAIFSDLSPVPQPSRVPPKGPWEVDRIPTDGELLARKDINNILKPYRFIDTMRNVTQKLEKAIIDISEGKLQLPSKAPRTRFNMTISSNRVFDGLNFELARVIAVKKAVGGTVNDVMLAICSGALRNYLLEKNELPEVSLITMCPVNIRTAANLSAETGNEVATMAVALRTDVADPKERMLAIIQETRNAKELTKAIGAKTMIELAQYTPTVLSSLGAKIAAEQGAANFKEPEFNTVTTNVPGPQIPLYSCGAESLLSYGLGLIQDGIGLFHTIGSYNGKVMISITACQDMMPDHEHYIALLKQSLEELELTFVEPLNAEKASVKKVSPKVNPNTAQSKPVTNKTSVTKRATPKIAAAKKQNAKTPVKKSVITPEAKTKSVATSKASTTATVKKTTPKTKPITTPKAKPKIAPKAPSKAITKPKTTRTVKAKPAIKTAGAKPQEMKRTENEKKES